MKAATCTAISLLLSFLHSCALAQATSTTGELNQQLGACKQQTGLKRATCFEKLATDAMSYINLPQSVPTGTAPPPTASSQLYADVRQQVSKEMIDPQSTQFRNVFVSMRSEKGAVVCGEVNSKNRAGGYVGFKRFVHVGKSSPVFEAEAEAVFPLWHMLCMKFAEQLAE